jgi:hypothetical protein
MAGLFLDDLDIDPGGQRGSEVAQVMRPDRGPLN